MDKIHPLPSVYHTDLELDAMLREGAIFLCCPKCKTYNKFSPSGISGVYVCCGCNHKIDFRISIRRH